MDTPHHVKNVADPRIVESQSLNYIELQDSLFIAWRTQATTEKHNKGCTHPLCIQLARVDYINKTITFATPNTLIFPARQ